MDIRRKFEKPSLSLNDQLNLIQNRGLLIPDRERALRYLQYIGYYRLSGYSIRFQNRGDGDGRHEFITGTSFDDVLDDYIFDRKLRLLVMDAMERIEVSAKAVIFNQLSERYGPHWYLNSSVFKEGKFHSSFISEIKLATGSEYGAKSKRRTVFLNHYFNKYSDPPLPPSWMIAEVLSMGNVSLLFKNLRSKDDQKNAMLRLGAPRIDVLESWLHALSYCRNICAHHTHLWNRTFTIKMQLRNPWKKHVRGDAYRKFYAQAVLMRHLLTTISPDSSWAENLKALLIDEHPAIPQESMGFPVGWQTLPYWNDPQR